MSTKHNDVEFESFKEEIDSFITKAKDLRLNVDNEGEDLKNVIDDTFDADKVLDEIVITNYDEEEKNEDKKEEKKPKNKEKIKYSKYLIAMLISFLFIPGFFTLFIIGKHTSYLIKLPFFFIIIYILVALLMIFGYSLYKYMSNKNDRGAKLKKYVKILLSIFYSGYIIGVIVFLILLYGPSYKFKDWLVTTAMSSMNHQYLCKWFYSDAEIKEVQSRNYVKEPDASTDPSLIGKKEEKVVYNEYEKEIMIHEKDEKYKIITFEVNGAKAYLAAIYDPSMIKAEVTTQVGVIGEYVTAMAERRKAILGINAGGFIDAGHNLGESPTGITIVDGKIITNNEYGSAVSTGGLIGFTEDDVLVLLKNVTAEEAIEMGVRDAVSWGPFLIVNGESATVAGNGGWGGGARSAIGQRKDGTVLFLVVDSNASRTNGAGMEDLVAIMERYGAYNAANLDGGTSSVMVVPREIAKNVYGASCSDYFTNYACAINDPIDAAMIHRTRYIATSFLVIDE